MVENIRVYNDILKRHERPYRPLADLQTSPELSPYPLLPFADNAPPASKPRAAKPNKKIRPVRHTPAK